MKRSTLLAFLILFSLPSYGDPPPDINFNLVDEVKKREPTPEELSAIKKLWSEMREIQEKPTETPPRPTISMVNLDLSPGSTPPVVRLSNKTGAVLTFMDANGNEWPIQLIRNLSSNEIDVEEKPAFEGQSSLFVKAKKTIGIGNIAVLLKDFKTPIVITLLAGQKDADYRVDFRVPAILGGKEIIPLPSHLDERLVPSVMGITPAGCQKTGTDNSLVMAWTCQEELIIRANGILLAPAPIDGKKIIGQSNTGAWIIPKTPVISMLIGGQVVNVRLGDEIQPARNNSPKNISKPAPKPKLNNRLGDENEN